MHDTSTCAIGVLLNVIYRLIDSCFVSGNISAEEVVWDWRWLALCVLIESILPRSGLLLSPEGHVSLRTVTEDSVEQLQSPGGVLMNSHSDQRAFLNPDREE